MTTTSCISSTAARRQTPAVHQPIKAVFDNTELSSSTAVIQFGHAYKVATVFNPQLRVETAANHLALHRGA